MAGNNQKLFIQRSSKDSTAKTVLIFLKKKTLINALLIWKQDIELFLYLIYFSQFSQNLFHLYTYLSRAIVFTDCGIYRAVTKVCLARIYWYAYLAITFISILACTVMMIGSKIQAISMRITNHFGAWIDSFGKEIMIQTQQNKSSHKHVLCPLFLFDQMSLISIIVP